MTTTQLTKLKDAGFTLEQIISIGEIFEPPHKPDRPAVEKPKSDPLKDVREAYERGKKEAEERHRQKEMGPLIRGDGWRYEPGPTCQGDATFRKRCDDFVRAHLSGMFLGLLETPPSCWVSQTLKLKP